MDTLKSLFTFEEEIKKSRFLVHALKVDDVEEAFTQLDKLSDPKASHNCWAYKISDLYRFSDDGEPAGTAGKPILSAIENQGLDHLLVIVTRYFGGIKLGASGLVRAYGGSAGSCLRLAPKIEIHSKVIICLQASFMHIGHVYSTMEQFRAKKLDEQFQAGGVVIRVELRESFVPEFFAQIRESCRDKVKLEICS